ncbi:hypothetical protein TNCV_417091 [Trichonephila clavipes]|nr:hypothetical protein TNCV_417091 [Trichonephila clavipes]
MAAFGYLLRKIFIRLSYLGQCRHPETMNRKKGLSPDEIANLLISEKELDGGELSRSNLDSDEDIRLSESDCEES